MDLSTILVGALNVACVGGFWYNIRQYKKNSETYNDLYTLKVHSPGRLFRAVRQSDFLKQAKVNPGNPDEFIFKGFIEGKVDCKDPIQSRLKKDAKLILSHYFIHELYSNDTWRNREEVIPEPKKREIRNTSNFALRDPESNSQFCLIHQYYNVDSESALERIGSKRHDKPLTILEKFLMVLLMVADFFRFKSDVNVPLFRGIKIGWTENELGISLNSILTAYGDIIYNKSDGTLRIESPLYLLKDKSNLLSRLSIKKTENIIWSVILSIPAAISTVYLGKMLIDYVKKYIRKRKELERDKSRNIKFLNLSDDYKCILCVNKPRDIILKPCMHFSICADCYHKIDKKQCPVCRKDIHDIVEIYFT